MSSSQPVIDAPPDRVAPMCGTHGMPMAVSEGGWVCPECEDAARRQARAVLAGAAAEAHQQHDRARGEALQQQRQKELEERIGAAGVPARFRAYDFETFPGQTEAAIAARNHLRSYALSWVRVKQQGTSVLLLGGTGTGKTGLACSVANRVMREFGATAMFTSAYGAVRHMRDTWGRRDRTEREALDDLVNVDLLILDEVGASVGSDAELTALFEVLNGRYAARQPTMLLSNLPLEDREVDGVKRSGLRTYLGGRIMDRFADDGSAVLALDWPSLRGRSS